MAENDLITKAKAETDAEKKPIGNALEGSGILQDFAGGGEKLAQGDWTEGLLDLAAGALDIKDFIKDPFESLLSMGFGWLIEHVDFLKEPLNWVTGDQDALDLEIQKWKQISGHLQETGEELASAVNKNCGQWRGPAADLYREFAQKQANACRDLSDHAKQVGDIVDICKTILNVVRTLIRDMISDALAKLVMILAKYPPPAYPVGLSAEGIPFLVGEGTKIAGEAAKAQRVLVRAGQKLADMVGNLPRFLKNLPLGHVFRDVLSDMPKNIGMEVGKEVGKQLGKIAFGKEPVGRESHEKRQQDRDKTKIEDPDPLFDQPGTKRISGSI
ncbi:hypothetical protein SAMN05421504_1021002 [Amycolatopsis xylanica]|uniref:Proteins of 100 residues with WXG n=1 Tax=Amycolatopsis xylanica TaxID=589385 RepID=A0A1H3ANY6_9PSEU|nr:hypothetical protein [Amycolatopsis xylanica]SDX31402.1 hypothetical protein SAMN05421504_1021002 [Amycolatopsis xylanica]